MFLMIGYKPIKTKPLHISLKSGPRISSSYSNRKIFSYHLFNRSFALYRSLTRSPVCSTVEAHVNKTGLSPPTKRSLVMEVSLLLVILLLCAAILFGKPYFMSRLPVEEKSDDIPPPASTRGLSPTITRIPAPESGLSYMPAPIAVLYFLRRPGH